VPVIVDGAAQIPPVSNLWDYTRLGAALAIFSGGKGLRGPQSSGLIVGRADLIEAVRLNGPPNQAIGRPMKVGKEEMVGLLAAVEWSLDQEEAYILAGYEATVQGWLEALGQLPGVTVERSYPSEAGQPHGRAIVRFDPRCPVSRDEVVAALWDQDPRIAVAAVGDDAIALNPQTLEPGEDELVLGALERVLAGAPMVAASA
jgi:L-seryl-tRNA(Ser) seleniumtransferase